MWWYRDKRTPDEGGAEPGADAPGRRILAQALGDAEVERRGAALMALLLDHRLVLGDGAVVEVGNAREAEQLVEAAASSRAPLRLYNHFARDWGEGTTLGDPDGLPPERAALLRSLRTDLELAGVSRLEPRG